MFTLAYPQMLTYRQQALPNTHWYLYAQWTRDRNRKVHAHPTHVRIAYGTLT